MPREGLAYLSDIVEACEAISSAIHGLDLVSYESNRLVRSSVEREFIIIGEAIAALARHAPELFARITQARRAVDFRNLLAHEYATVDDAIVWAIADRGVPVLRSECEALMARILQGETD
ncbi:MAG: DUF86 domain-containing protein [Armatimonadetes bacterium]|nr:DUF86 domain-containing protein [Armatimonadota bacterium]